MSVSEQLTRYFAVPDAEIAERFFDIFTKIESFEGTFCGFIDLSVPFHHIYLSPSIETILGYPRSTYYASQKFEFMSSITPLSHWPMISYRKHLIGKFKSKNTGELVKKTSKIFGFRASLLYNLRGIGVHSMLS